MRLLDTKRAAAILGVNDSRVRQFILAGRLPAQKISRDWVIFEKDLKKVANRKSGRPRKKNKKLTFAGA